MGVSSAWILSAYLLLLVSDFLVCGLFVDKVHYVVALILFVFAVTSGSVNGWGTARAITPLVLSVILAVAFFFWEARLPEVLAAVYVTHRCYCNHLLTIHSAHP